MIRNKEEACFNGLIEEDILEVGLMVNNMEGEHMSRLMELKEKVNGQWVREIDG
jgi:hypothetical protein